MRRIWQRLHVRVRRRLDTNGELVFYLFVPIFLTPCMCLALLSPSPPSDGGEGRGEEAPPPFAGRARSTEYEKCASARVGFRRGTAQPIRQALPGGPLRHCFHDDALRPL